MRNCPKCNCSAYSLDGHYMAKLRGRPDRVQRTRVKCKYCGNRYTLDPIVRINPACPHCASTHVKKQGFAKGGSQKYKCAACSKNFQDGELARRLTAHQKKMAVFYAKQGFTENSVAKALGIGTTTVRRLLGKDPRR